MSIMIIIITFDDYDNYNQYDHYGDHMSEMGNNDPIDDYGPAFAHLENGSVVIWGGYDSGIMRSGVLPGEPVTSTIKDIYYHDGDYYSNDGQTWI